MRVKIVDTNVILRFLVGDNTKQLREAKQLFAEAEAGEIRLVIKPLVVAEVCFVLESFYKQPRGDIADMLEVFLAQRWLEVEERETVLNLWVWYREGLHLVDSYLLAWAKSNQAKIASFDQKLLKNL